VQANFSVVRNLNWDFRIFISVGELAGFKRWLDKNVRVKCSVGFRPNSNKWFSIFGILRSIPQVLADHNGSGNMDGQVFVHD
jgi:hypothetical protein